MGSSGSWLLPPTLPTAPAFGLLPQRPFGRNYHIPPALREQKAMFSLVTAAQQPASAEQTVATNSTMMFHLILKPSPNIRRVVTSHLLRSIANCVVSVARKVSTSRGGNVACMQVTDARVAARLRPPSGSRASHPETAPRPSIPRGPFENPVKSIDFFDSPCSFRDGPSMPRPAPVLGLRHSATGLPLREQSLGDVAGYALPNVHLH
jgi:hypothetical protein